MYNKYLNKYIYKIYKKHFKVSYQIEDKTNMQGTLRAYMPI